MTSATPFLSWADRSLRQGDGCVQSRDHPPAGAADAEPSTARSGTRRSPCPICGSPSAGNMAVDGVTLSVGAGEIVGLIGSNGAGKSTLMNADRRLRASHGLGAAWVTRRSATSHRPIGPGWDSGRTFQSATLFPELTVTETLLVALEGKSETGVLSTALGLPRATRRSRHDRAEVGDLVEFLGLGGYRDHYIADLSTGTRRIVELAGLLALDAKVLCLDEPTAGLAQRETEAFGPLIVTVQQPARRSVLLIEHDMPLIMGISDRVYCLEAGAVIAEGPPASVRRTPGSSPATSERTSEPSSAAARHPSIRRDRSEVPNPPRSPRQRSDDSRGTHPRTPGRNRRGDWNRTRCADRRSHDTGEWAGDRRQRMGLWRTSGRPG